MSYLIYKHTNKLNGMIYIGQTHFTQPKLRWQNGNGYKTSIKFYNAIQKYGWSAFSHQILVENIKTKDEANMLEKYYIDLYDSILNGYNISKGGDDCTHRAKIIYKLDENKNILAIYTSLLAAEDATGVAAKNIYKACAGKIKSAGGNYWCYADNFETLIIEPSSKLIAKCKIYQLNEYKVILNTFNSITDAANFLGVPGSTSKISNCCQGKRCTAYGYYWCYCKDYNTYQIRLPYQHPYNATAIVQLDDNYKEIQRYETISSAEKALGVKLGNVSRACRDKNKKVAGYHWTYLIDYEDRLNEERESEN